MHIGQHKIELVVYFLCTFTPLKSFTLAIYTFRMAFSPLRECSSKVFCRNNMFPLNLMNLIFIFRCFKEKTAYVSSSYCTILEVEESYSAGEKAIDLGFTSVMIDASMESFDNNVKKQAVKACFFCVWEVKISALAWKWGM
mgnify:CR=1 FL=1